MDPDRSGGHDRRVDADPDLAGRLAYGPTATVPPEVGRLVSQLRRLAVPGALNLYDEATRWPGETRTERPPPVGRR